MLHRACQGGFEEWNTGCAMFFIGQEGKVGQLPVAVRCRLGGLKEVVALLDTGASWSVMDGGTAGLLEGQIEDLGISLQIGTRLGSFQGTLHRVELEFLSDPGSGRNLHVDATVLVLPQWPGPVVLGYHGLLERIRLALDPHHEPPTFYFGCYEHTR